MKKFLVVFFVVFALFTMNSMAIGFNTFVYDSNRESGEHNSVKVSATTTWKPGSEYTIERPEKLPLKNIPDEFLAEAKPNEHMVILDLKTDDTENPYPEIESMTVKVFIPGGYTGPARYLGKDYRMIYFGADGKEDISDHITKSALDCVEFTTDKLGKYVIYLNPAVYSVVFYSEEPIYDADGNITNPEECIYTELKDLKRNEILSFPEIPQKDGYVFTGWYTWMHYGKKYAGPAPIEACSENEYFADWCPEDTYEPIKLEISSEQTIRKGKEDGKVITLTTNYGVFASK